MVFPWWFLMIPCFIRANLVLQWYLHPWKFGASMVPSMLIPWRVHDASTEAWYFHRAPMVILWLSHGASTVLLLL